MRIARNDSSLRTALQQASAEAENAFKDGTVYIEKLVEYPRHVEVQVIADSHGNIVYLYERDCSLQRRYQKLVEESPAPSARPRGLDPYQPPPPPPPPPPPEEPPLKPDSLPGGVAAEAMWEERLSPREEANRGSKMRSL